MRVSVLQQEIKYGYRCFNESPDLEFLKQKANESLDDCFAMLEQASKDGADIAVTTETVNNILALGDRRFPYPQIYEGVDGATVKRFSEFARDRKMYIVAGLLLTIEGKTYNCAVLFGRDGEIVGIHRKVHLPAGEEINVSHGDRFEVFHTEIGNIGMLVCWDLQYPEAVRELALAGADIIVCPTFGWENIYGLCRAYESSVSIAAAMCYRGGFSGYCDPSCIVDNMGRIVAAAPRDSAAVLTADIDIKKEPDPQYNSHLYWDSHSMRKTRFLQRRPQTYNLINKPIEETPLYKRYFTEESEELKN